MHWLQTTTILLLSGLISCDNASSKTNQEGNEELTFHVHLEQLASGLENPVFLTHANDGSGRLFLILQQGKVLILKDGKVLEEPFLDITEEVEDLDGSFSEMGLLGFAFSPDYRESRKVYAYYSHAKSEDNSGHVAHLSEFTVSAENPDRVDPLTKRNIMEINCVGLFVNGGHIEFGPDGLLYIGVGEGQEKGLAQNNDFVNGSILRIDVSGQETYSIPSDNPFIAGKAPEIWAYGLRNPYRFSFDPLTKHLICSDVGDLIKEEVNRIEKGQNYGWPDYEGTVKSDEANIKLDDIIPPLAAYDHQKGFGSAIVGSYVYRGSSYPDLVGKLIVADWSGDMFYKDGLESGPLKSLVIDNLGDYIKPERDVEVFDGEEVILPKYYINSLAVDEQGEIYMVGQKGMGLRESGSVFRLQFGQQTEVLTLAD